MVKIDLWEHKEVTGILSPRFSELPDLEVLSLKFTKVSGDIEALKNLPKLTELNLYKTHVIGDIAVLKNLRKLTSLNLAYTNVIGDIAALENFRHLWILRLSYTNVSGNMAALKKARKLGQLSLSYTNVSSSLDKDFKQLKNLEHLNLENTKTSGDIAMLHQNRILKYLNLHNTSVFGDLAALQRATQLKEFHNFEVSNTKITCPQDAALTAVLVKLGFQEQQLGDLHAMEGPRWMLCSRSSLTVYSLAAYGLAINFYWERRNRIMRKT